MNAGTEDLKSRKLSVIPDKIVLAVERCLRHNIPFALFAHPDSHEVRFFASHPSRYSGLYENGTVEWVEMKEFRENASDLDARVYADFSAADILGAETLPTMTPPESSPEQFTTPALYYLAQSRSIIDSLKRNEKVVLSRVISGVSEAESLGDILRKIFCSESQISTFRYMISTPATGVWMGATPELLGKIRPDGDKVEFTTMALAGTRRSDTGNINKGWDEGIRIEHLATRRFIERALKSLGPYDYSATSSTLKAGEVEHLLTLFQIRVSLPQAMQLLQSLNPTPAVAGYPRALAYRLIDNYETHTRNCYSGVIEIDNPQTGESLWYVNLRCAHLGASDDRFRYRNFPYSVYAGGGLTRLSTPEEEWMETSRKAAPLLAALQGVPLSQLPMPDLYAQIKLESTISDETGRQ